MVFSSTFVGEDLKMFVFLSLISLPVSFAFFFFAYTEQVNDYSKVVWWRFFESRK
jgi:hypothetical protein